MPAFLRDTSWLAAAPGPPRPPTRLKLQEQAGLPPEEPPEPPKPAPPPPEAQPPEPPEPQPGPDGPVPRRPAPEEVAPAPRPIVEQVSWNEYPAENACDPDAIFQVRAQARRVFSSVHEQVCRREYQEEDKRLLRLQTEFDDMGQPKCTNDYWITDAATSMATFKKCVTSAAERANHIRDDDMVNIEDQIRQLDFVIERRLLQWTGYFHGPADPELPPEKLPGPAGPEKPPTARTPW